MNWEFHAANAGSARSARKEFASFLHGSCTPQSDCEAAEITFGELIANAARHAPGPIDISVYSDANGAVWLEMCDTGRAFAVTPAFAPFESPSGRGLYIVSQLCPHLTSTRTKSGNKVSVVLPVQASVP